MVVFFLISLGFFSGCSMYTPNVQEIPDSELEATDFQDLTLDNGDEVEIRVYPHENMTRKIRIPASKVIYYPMAGEININNKGVSEIRRILTQKLEAFFVNPQVSVEVTTQRSKNIYVMGEVTQTGPLPVDSNLRAIDAISKAGGFTLNASSDSVVLVRNTRNETQMKILDLKNIINAEGGVDNVALKSGDIIYVPRTFVADLDRFLDHVQKGLITGLMVQQGIVLYPAVVDAIKGVGSTNISVGVGNQ